jgi:hypothetical protein
MGSSPPFGTMIFNFPQRIECVLDLLPDYCHLLLQFKSRLLTLGKPITRYTRAFVRVCKK